MMLAEGERTDVAPDQPRDRRRGRSITRLCAVSELPFVIRSPAGDPFRQQRTGVVTTGCDVHRLGGRRRSDDLAGRGRNRQAADPERRQPERDAMPDGPARPPTGACTGRSRGRAAQDLPLTLTHVPRLL
jgi:hypothetical protein